MHPVVCSSNRALFTFYRIEAHHQASLLNLVQLRNRSRLAGLLQSVEMLFGLNVRYGSWIQPVEPVESKTENGHSFFTGKELREKIYCRW